MPSPEIACRYIALCFTIYTIYISAHYQNILKLSLNSTSLKNVIESSNTWQNVANY